jgi:hypothetical protein
MPEGLPQKVVTIHNLFLALETRLLDFEPVRSRFGDEITALTEWKYAFFHPNNKTQLLKEHQCYDLIMRGSKSRPLIESTLTEIEAFAFFKPIALSNSRPFVTSTGHIGIIESWDTLLPDDLLCLFHGGSIPFILRKSDTQYRLVSACYVHSLMDLAVQKRYLDENENIEFALV